MAVYTWATKDPDEVLDYVHDWTSRVGDDDTITGTPIAIVDDNSGAVIDDSTLSGNMQTVWVSGGQSTKTARITLRITTIGGRIYEEGITLPILSFGV